MLLTINQKVEDWKKLREITDKVRDLRGESQHKAYEEFVAKSKLYISKYQERFNPFKRPQWKRNLDF